MDSFDEKKSRSAGVGWEVVGMGCGNVELDLRGNNSHELGEKVFDRQFLLGIVYKPPTLVIN